MSRTRIPQALRALVAESDLHRCVYCQSTVAIVGMPFEIDHIIPEALGGQTVFENLCLCCAPCNERKASRITAIDPLLGTPASLFHPRRQVWAQHFAWIDGGVSLEGLSPIGRATVLALQLNRPLLQVARRSWISVGWHPPKMPVKRRPR